MRLSLAARCFPPSFELTLRPAGDALHVALDGDGVGDGGVDDGEAHDE